MRLPSKVTIGGRTFPVTRVSGDGGQFRLSSPLLEVGRGGTDEEQMQTFIHEVLEMVLTERCHRYEGYPDTNFMFMLDHRQFCEVVKDLHLALKGVLK